MLKHVEALKSNPVQHRLQARPANAEEGSPSVFRYLVSIVRNFHNMLQGFPDASRLRDSFFFCRKRRFREIGIFPWTLSKLVMIEYD